MKAATVARALMAHLAHLARRNAVLGLARCAAPVLLLAWSAGSWSQASEVVVTGLVRSQALLDAPFAITRIDAAALRSAGPMVNLSEVMAQVPGVVVNNRNNYAQDLQISSRGFGARAAVRGLRL